MTDTQPSIPDVKSERQSFAALRVPGARPFLAFTGLVMMADNIEHVISYWVIYEKFQSPALNGFAVISHWVPFLLFSVMAGALADRYDPRRVIQTGIGLFILVSLSWAVLIFTDTLEQWHAGVLLVVHGMSGVLWGPVSQVLLHDIVKPAQLHSAVRLLAMSRMIGLFLGPAVGGGLMLLFGPSLGLLINTLIYLPLMLWLWKAPFGPKFRDAPLAPRRAIRGLADIVTTFREISGIPVIISMILLVGVTSSFVGYAYQAQMPVFAIALGRAESSLSYSLLLSASALGAITAGVILEWFDLMQARRRSAFILVALWCCSLVGFAVTAHFTVALVLLFVIGFLQLSFTTMSQTLVQINSPPDIRGRVIGLYSMAALGMMTFSGFTIGVAGDYIGVHLSLGISACLVLAIVTLAVVPMAFRRVRQPAE
ncbi:MAG: MFS transporter [Rhodospirillales bacterium]|nr:MFS transporter [Rhodospirillales bacterium]